MLSGTPVSQLREMEDFALAKFYCPHALAEALTIAITRSLTGVTHTKYVCQLQRRVIHRSVEPELKQHVLRHLVVCHRLAELVDLL